MTQFRTFNYEDDDSTFSLNRWRLLMMPPGRYVGYTPVLAGNMNLTLTTGGLNSRKANIDGVTFSNELSMCVSPQGTVIEEDADIILPIITPLVNDRIDLIICEHLYNPIAGGQAALYSVIQGIESVTPVAPALGNDAIQIILGSILVKKDTVALNAVGNVYTTPSVPIYSNDTAIWYDQTDNLATGVKTINKYKTVPVEATINVGTKEIILPSPSNQYYIENVDESWISIRSFDISAWSVGERLGFGHNFEINTKQNLGIDAWLEQPAMPVGAIVNSGGGFFTPIKAGDLLKVQDMMGHPSAADPYYSFKAEKHMDWRNGMICFNSGESSDLVGVTLTLTLDEASTGNYYNLNNTTGALAGVAYISRVDITQITPTLEAVPAGAGNRALLYLRVLGDDVELAATGSVPDGYAAMRLPGGAATLLAPEGNLIEILFDGVAWLVLRVIDTPI